MEESICVLRPIKPSKRTPETQRLLRVALPFYAQKKLSSVADHGGASPQSMHLWHSSLS
jgi:hypothetical protein